MSHMGTRAFTLIELPVVVAIIALLISILLAPLSTSTESSSGIRIATCDTTAPMTAVTLWYATDSRESVPGGPSNQTRVSEPNEPRELPARPRGMLPVLAAVFWRSPSEEDRRRARRCLNAAHAFRQEALIRKASTECLDAFFVDQDLIEAMRKLDKAIKWSRSADELAELERTILTLESNLFYVSLKWHRGIGGSGGRK